MKQVFLLLLACSTLISCRQVVGDRDLGNNITLLVGRKTEDQAIVYCPDKNKPCTEGVFLIPLIKGSKEYIEDYKSDHDWIIARTVKDNKRSFWIINKDSKVGDKDCRTTDCGQYIKTFVSGPMTFEDFEGALEEWKVKMHLMKE